MSKSNFKFNKENLPNKKTIRKILFVIIPMLVILLLVTYLPLLTTKDTVYSRFVIGGGSESATFVNIDENHKKVGLLTNLIHPLKPVYSIVVRDQSYDNVIIYVVKIERDNIFDFTWNLKIIEASSVNKADFDKIVNTARFSNFSELDEMDGQEVNHGVNRSPKQMDRLEGLMERGDYAGISYEFGINIFDEDGKIIPPQKPFDSEE